MKKVIFIIIVLLFLLPQFLSGDRYYLGGDDGGLYYLYPKEFIQNFASNIVTDNSIAGASMGYNPLFYYIPFLLFIMLLKQIPYVNIQGLMYGLNLSGGFVFFYLFLGLWMRNKDLETRFTKIISSFLYIFSPFLIGTLYTNQYIAIYLISIIPSTSYFFTKGILDKKFYLVVISILVFSIFSTLLITFPWWGAFLLTFTPVAIYLIIRRPSVFTRYSISAALIFLVLNFYWIFHFIYSYLTSGGSQSSLEFYSEGGIMSENLRIAEGVSRTFSPFNVIFQTMISKNYADWGLLTFLNITFLLLILTAGILVSKDKSAKLKIIYYLSLVGLLISWFLFSPNVGSWGPSFFVSFVKVIPFFGAFRNMFDKFSLSLSFYFAFSFAISFLILVSNSKKKFKGLAITYFLLTVILAANYFSLFSKENIAKRRVSGRFDNDYLKLMEYLKKSDNESRIMWLPLNSPTYTYIEDPAGPKRFYSGVSPTRILADKTDYAGRFSFIIPGDIFLGDRILFELLPNKEYQKVAEIFQNLNIGYIIVDHRQYPDEIEDYYFNLDRKIIKHQTNEFYDEVLGEKVKDFGETFSLYKIKDKYLSDKIMLIAGDEENADVDLTYHKLESYKFLVEIKNISKISDLVFKESFDDRWNIYMTNGKQLKLYDKYLENTNADFYGNSWLINPEFIESEVPESFYKINSDESLDINLIIYFEPQKYVEPMFGLSITAFLLSCGYVFYFLSKKSFRKLKKWLI